MAIRVLVACEISIHVPLAGDDFFIHRLAGVDGISIHVPLAGDDGWTADKVREIFGFLSTSPLRGTTQYSPKTGYTTHYFYPRPPCGGRHINNAVREFIGKFLSTSPLRGTTRSAPLRVALPRNFYPRPPCGGRLYADGVWVGEVYISIHVPLAGDDFCAHRCTARQGAISIHVPLAGDDRWRSLSCPRTHISIHVPLAGDDRRSRRSRRCPRHFYPRPPCGGRPFALGLPAVTEEFLSTSPLRGTTMALFISTAVG